MNDIIHEIRNNKIIAIIRADDTKDIEKVINSLYQGGIRIVEITLNTPGALKSIEKVKDLYSDLIVGAGTVLDSESARLAILSGAKFLLAPTLKKSTIDLANRYNTVIVPGVFTPTEALTAYEYGAKMVKVFPARSVGERYISDLKGPLPQLDFMAVGGISLTNTKEFLKAGSCSVGVGGALVDYELVKKGEYEEIRKRAEKFVNIAKNIN